MMHSRFVLRRERLLTKCSWNNSGRGWQIHKIMVLSPERHPSPSSHIEYLRLHTVNDVFTRISAQSKRQQRERGGALAYYIPLRPTHLHELQRAVDPGRVGPLHKQDERGEELVRARQRRLGAGGGRPIGAAREEARHDACAPATHRTGAELRSISFRTHPVVCCMFWHTNVHIPTRREEKRSSMLER